MNKTTNLTRLFGFDPQTMNVRTEIIAGITTFLTMAYILAVNPNIMGDIGMDKGAIFTTTAIISMFSTLIMALYARLPFALAPGMGLNAFFAYTVCTKMGYDWSFALTAVLIEGVAFIILTETNLRDAIVNAIPASIRNAIGPGIGLYIAFIGLKNGGVIASSPATVVTLGNIRPRTALHHRPCADGHTAHPQRPRCPTARHPRHDAHRPADGPDHVWRCGWPAAVHRSDRLQV